MPSSSINREQLPDAFSAVAESKAASACPPVNVAVGIVLKPDGTLLLAQRPAGKPYAGYWEFPGGKVEPEESVLNALQRELLEELGLRVQAADPWCCVEHVYPHAHVRLHFYLVRQWQGAPQSLEGQSLAWEGEISVAPLLPATIPLLQWLEPLRYSQEA